MAELSHVPFHEHKTASITDVTQAFYIFKFFFFALGIAAEMACPERQAIIANSPTRRGTPKNSTLNLKKWYFYFRTHSDSIVRVTSIQ
jgi:hypothetical protein